MKLNIRADAFDGDYNSWKQGVGFNLETHEFYWRENDNDISTRDGRLVISQDGKEIIIFVDKGLLSLVY